MLLLLLHMLLLLLLQLMLLQLMLLLLLPMDLLLLQLDHQKLRELLPPELVVQLLFLLLQQGLPLLQLTLLKEDPVLLFQDDSYLSFHDSSSHVGLHDGSILLFTLCLEV